MAEDPVNIANLGYAEIAYAQWCEDPASVAVDWRALFEADTRELVDIGVELPNGQGGLVYAVRVKRIRAVRHVPGLLVSRRSPASATGCRDIGTLLRMKRRAQFNVGIVVEI